MGSIEDLRKGYKYSLVALVFLVCMMALFLIYGFSIFFVYLLIFLSIATLITWGYGLVKRAKAWKSLGQTKTAYSLLGAILVLASSLPIVPWDAFVPRITLIPSAAWGIYTLLENLGLRRLNSSNKIDTKRSRICSLLGVSVYFIVRFLGYLLPIYTSLPLEYFMTMIVMGRTSYEFFVPFLFAMPFLAASCVLSIKSLKKLNS
jgi:hypothetical protein